MAALTGYAVSLAVSAGTWTPTVRKSAAGNITDASGGSTLTIPWVDNLNAGGTNTNSKLLASAVQAAYRALIDDRSANGDPT